MGKKCDTVHGTLLMHRMSVRLCGGVRAMLRIDSCGGSCFKILSTRHPLSSFFYCRVIIHIHGLMSDLESIHQSRSADPSFCTHVESLLCVYVCACADQCVTVRQLCQLDRVSCSGNRCSDGPSERSAF